MPAKLIIGPLCIALYAAFGLSNLPAQTAVGYINVTLKPGFNLVSVPLSSSRDTVAELFDSAYSVQAFPSGLTVFLYRDGAYATTVYNPVTESFQPAGPADEAIALGEAFWVYNPSAIDLTLTLSGEIPHGTLVNQLERGYNLAGSSVPKGGSLSELSFPHAPGDIVYVWDAANQRFRTSVFDDLLNDWIPFEPVLETAQGFITWKNTVTDWIQSLEP